MQLITDNGVYVMESSSLWVDEEGSLRLVSSDFAFHAIPLSSEEIEDEE